MTDNLITILTFTYPHEIVIIRSKLESEGIECFALNENTVQAYPLYSNALGGIKLQVRESDLDNAMVILREGGYVGGEEPCYHSRFDSESEKYKGTDSETVLKESTITCPSCGSHEVSKQKLSKSAFVVTIILFGFPLPFMSRTYHCFGCGNDFKNR